MKRHWVVAGLMVLPVSTLRAENPPLQEMQGTPQVYQQPPDGSASPKPYPRPAYQAPAYQAAPNQQGQLGYQPYQRPTAGYQSPDAQAGYQGQPRPAYQPQPGYQPQQPYPLQPAYQPQPANQPQPAYQQQPGYQQAPAYQPQPAYPQQPDQSQRGYQPQPGYDQTQRAYQQQQPGYQPYQSTQPAAAPPQPHDPSQLTPYLPANPTPHDYGSAPTPYHPPASRQPQPDDILSTPADILAPDRGRSHASPTDSGSPPDEVVSPSEDHAQTMPPDADTPNAQAPGTEPPAGPAPPQWPNKWLPATTAHIDALDKVNAQATSLTVKVGEPATFGSLTITVKSCMVRPPDEPADAAAFVNVTDSHPDQPGFDGWMLAKEPSVSMLENPIYDLRVTGCA